MRRSASPPSCVDAPGRPTIWRMSIDPRSTSLAECSAGSCGCSWNAASRRRRRLFFSASANGWKAATRNDASTAMTTGDQREVISFLSSPEAYGSATLAVERIDTHISVVWVAGDRVYKLKRAVCFDYVDFS